MKKIPAGECRGATLVITFVTCVGSVALAGCGSLLPESTTIDASDIGYVQKDIKRQVGDYLLYVHREVRSGQAKTNEKTPTTGSPCEMGNNIDFQIDSLLLELHTTITNDTIGDLGIKSLKASGATIDPSVGGGRKSENSQQIKFYEYPVPDGYYQQFFAHKPFANVEKGAGLTTVLIALHQGLLEAREVSPCMSGINYTATEQKDSNTYVIGLKITGHGEKGIKVAVGPIAIGASHERVVERDNSLTVTFRPFDFNALPKVKGDSKRPFNPILYAGHRDYSGLPGVASLEKEERFDHNVNFAAQKKPSPMAESKPRVFTLCRENEFTFWCENKDQKVKLSVNPSE